MAARTYQHANEPKPAADETNGFKDVVVADPRTGKRETEQTFIPETHVGGFYRNAQGKLVNAHGHSLELPEGDTGHDEPITLNTVLAEIGPDNPLAQRLIAQRSARERQAAQRAAADAPPMVETAASGPAPPQLPEDIRAAERYQSRAAARAKASS